MITPFRKTSQFILPARKITAENSGYEIYPSFPLPHGSVHMGMTSLAERMQGNQTVIIDGYVGVLWDDFRDQLNRSFINLGIKVSWLDFSGVYKSSEIIDDLVRPFLGGNDPLFGKRTTLQLIDFIDPGKLEAFNPGQTNSISIVYGTGSFLSGINGLRLYLDVPKNEIQYRSRAGSITNLGCAFPGDPKAMYKRFYFVDWIVLNRHKEQFIDTIDILADVQRPDTVAWAFGHDVMEALDAMAVNYFRVRPWFEPGTWGGQWIRDHITGLSKEVPNYAWSFELIVPENGLVFESDNALLEISFDWLMYRAGEKVLGHCYKIFHNDFPIRFDFLDTFGGGNLSIQCHPDREYMKAHFGEDFTQEETYYILDAEKDAAVYLGFTHHFDPEDFRNALEASCRDTVPLETGRYIQLLPSAKHDLFLIPPGTIHGSGSNNLVLEISSTPYIFTFKLYDWLRPDLDGKPRPLNITRGMDNLRFDRCGETVKKELIAQPVLLKEGPDWKLWHLPTHADHLFDVHRYEFTREILVETDWRCHVLSLVEGQSIMVETINGMRQQFSYAETFVIPAAAESYRVINQTPGRVMLIKAFVK